MGLSAISFVALLLLHQPLRTSSTPYKNIASTGHATQSDDYAYWYSADKAIDGDTSPYPNNGASNSVSMTMSSAERAWWRLEFDKEVLIERVHIYNRLSHSQMGRESEEGEINSARLFIDTTHNPSWTVKYSAREKVYRFNEIGLVGREVKIQGGEESGRLQLAEVEVFGGEKFCTGLSEEMKRGGLGAMSKFPVITGYQVNVKCKEKGMRMTGSSLVRCVSGTEFEVSVKPTCVIGDDDDDDDDNGNKDDDDNNGNKDDDNGKDDDDDGRNDDDGDRIILRLSKFTVDLTCNSCISFL